MSAASPHLPAGALYDGVLLAALERAAQPWARRWFTPKDLPTFRAVPEALVDHHSFGLHDDTVGIGDGGRAKVRTDAGNAAELGALALGLRPSRQNRGDADRQFLGRMGEEIARELGETLSEWLAQVAGSSLPTPPSDGAAPVNWRTFVMRHDGASERLVASVEIATHDAILSRRALAAPSSPRDLRPLLGALAPASVNVCARLGEARVRLDELRAISLGDVLVLDRERTADVELCVAGRVQPALKARLGHAGGALVLALAGREET